MKKRPDMSRRVRSQRAIRAGLEAAWAAWKKPIGAVRYDNGYRKVRTERGWEYEHRMVMERITGKPIPKGKHVHHRNGNRLDNRPENLVLLDLAEHAAKHGRIANWSRKHRGCTECFTTKRRHQGGGLCSRCWNRKAYRERRAPKRRAAAS